MEICKDEIWIDVIGYEGKYKISNSGIVKSLFRFRNISGGGKQPMPERILKPGLAGDGYLFVALFDNYVQKITKIHNLVALHFIGVRPHKYDVNHKDGNKLNNHVDNLEYCTRSANLIHAIKTGLRKNPSPWKGKFGSDHVRHKDYKKN